MSGDNLAFLFYFSLLLLFVGAGVLYRNRGRLSQTLQQVAIWVLIFVGVVIAYGFSGTLQSQLLPSRASQIDAGSYSLQRQGDGHFYLTLEVNGTPIEFVVDTGASQVVLTRSDAQKLGFNPDNLAFLGRAYTANGVVKTASVVLDRVQLGEIEDFNVQAEVNGGDMDGSLLGMTYLSKFQELSIRGNTLTLTR